jgi:hypothetical protein
MGDDEEKSVAELDLTGEDLEDPDWRAASAEDAWIADLYDWRTDQRMSGPEIRAWLHALGRLVDRPPPRVSISGPRAELAGVDGQYTEGGHILLHPRTGANLRVVCHEAAHWLVEGDPEGEHHGPAWTSVFLDLVHLAFDQEVADALRRSYLDWGVAIGD